MNGRVNARFPIVPRPADKNESAPHPSQRSLRGLDWFIFFVADIQTGFGPFIAVYLTSQKWTQIDIGLVLSAGGLIALLGQMPGGALVDAARSERLVAGLALAAISVSALAYAFFPIFPVVLAAAALHAAASCVLGPCIVAMSLGLVGHAAIGERLGRNARFAAIGNGGRGRGDGRGRIFLRAARGLLRHRRAACPDLAGARQDTSGRSRSGARPRRRRGRAIIRRPTRGPSFASRRS